MHAGAGVTGAGEPRAGVTGAQAGKGHGQGRDTGRAGTRVGQGHGEGRDTGRAGTRVGQGHGEGRGGTRGGQGRDTGVLTALIPELDTATKAPLPYATDIQLRLSFADAWLVHVAPLSVEVMTYV